MANDAIIPDNEFLPAKAISISDEKSSKWVADFIGTVAETQPSPIPFILDISKADTMDLVEKRLTEVATIKFPNNADQQNKFAKSWKKTFKQLKSEEAWNWQQDMFVSFWDEGSNEISVRSILNYYSDPKFRRKQIEVEAILKNLGFTIDYPIVATKGMKNGYMGGNVESAPNGLCLIGTDGLNETQMQELSRQVCRGKNSYPIKVPTHFLEVGHVDEIFKTIPLPGKPAPCNFAYAIASPRKALELLKKNPQAKMVHYQNISETENLNREAGYIWHKYREEIMGPPEEPPKTEEPKHGHWLDKIVFPRAIAGMVIDSIKANAEEDSPMILPLTQGRFLAKFLGSEENTFNDLIQDEIDSFTKELLKATAEKIPGCRPEIIELPQLFDGRAEDKGEGLLDISSAHARSFLPNPSNAVFIEGTLIAPDPGNANFNYYLSEQYKRLGISYRIVDSLPLHNFDGNVHCSTNVFRAAPRKTVP